MKTGDDLWTRILENEAFIIAEAGVNHNGSLKKAKELVDVAEDVGVDAVKFQMYDTDDIISEEAPKADYQKEGGGGESQKEMARKFELSKGEFEDLFKYTREKDLIFLCSPFDRKSIDRLDKMGISAFKIPSGEITNTPYLEKIAEKSKPIILSTGMSTLSEVEKAVDVIRDQGANRLAILQCVSSYPTDIEDINLKAMDTLSQAFDAPSGLSDHTLGLTAPVAAVARGANIIEKHYTLDKSLPGPDHEMSLSPQDLEDMVEKIRKTETALGNGVKKPVSSEIETKEVARKSIVAKKKIQKGEKINRDNISVKRPGSGIDPDKIPELIERKAAEEIEEDRVLSWEMLE